MADTRNTSLLETFLSINDSKAELTSRLKLQDVSRLSQTCKSIRTLFKKPLDQLAAERLLDLAIKAEWNKMEKLVASNPSFMFQPADGIDIDGTKIKCSPLQYLLYVHDYYGQAIFEAYARKHNLLKEFVEHAHLQQTEFDLKPFYQVYETYPTLSKSLIDTFWREKIGNAHLHQLPRHMLKQMCTQENRNNYTWTPLAQFNDVQPLRDGCFAYHYKGVKKVDAVHPASLVGVNCALVRGHPFHHINAILKMYGPDAKIVSHDFEVFKALFTVRQKQQVTRISRLAQELQVLENTKRPSKKRSLL